MLHLLRLISVLLLTVPSALIADELTESVNRAIEKAGIAAGKIEIPVNKVGEEGRKAAQEAAKTYESADFQNKIKCEQQRLREEVFADTLQGEEVNFEQTASGRLEQNEKVYLFLSSSIPDHIVRSYMEALEKLNDPSVSLLMKGYAPNQSTNYLLRITRKDKSCVDQLQRRKPVICERFEIPIKVKPSLFEKFEVTGVPALIYENQQAVWKITGDGGLDYMIERINSKANSQGLRGMVTALQRGAYE